MVAAILPHHDIAQQRKWAPVLIERNRARHRLIHVAAKNQLRGFSADIRKPDSGRSQRALHRHVPLLGVAVA